MLWAVLVCCIVGQVVSVDISGKDAYRLSNNAQYLALAPKKVHPLQTYQLYITLFSMPFNKMELRAVLSQDGSEYASTTVTAYQKGTKRLQLLVPVTVTQGKHKLTIEGLVGSTQKQDLNELGLGGQSRLGQLGHPIFKNETMLSFDSKYVSLFIQTDRPIYYTSYAPHDKVLFRVVGTTPDLQPVSGPMTIYVKDGIGDIVRRYFQKQLNFGIYEDQFPIPFPCREGTWTMEAHAFGHVYEQNFTVGRWFPERFEVNMSVPLYIFDTEWGVSGLVMAQHLSGRFVTGNITIEVNVRKPDGSFIEGTLYKVIAWLDRQVPFSFALSDIEDEFGPLAGNDLHFKAWFFDWFWLETQNSTCVTKVIKDGIKLKALGRRFRTFKPRVPFTVYFAVQRTDGTPYEGFLNRQIEVTEEHYGSQDVEKKMIIPDDAIVRLEVMPHENDNRIKVWARHPVTGTTVELECYRYWSDFNRYLSISTSTELPKVNEYMIFTVRANFFVEDVNYLIIAGGNVLLGSSIALTSKQKTFSVALSRKMAPRARILIYAVIDGEVLADSLNFFVEDTRLHKASIEINTGKDFRGDTIELIGKGTPGAYLSTSGLDYELYKRGANTFLTREKVIQELLTFDEPNEGPYQHTWWHDSPLWESSVFFNAPTYGVDHLTTFNLSGLAALSDMNLTATPELEATKLIYCGDSSVRGDGGGRGCEVRADATYTIPEHKACKNCWHSKESHRCNATLGLGRCKNGACFDLRTLCDGKIDCVIDGFDEMNCPVPPARDARETALKDLHLISRYFAPTEWLWHTTYIKHYGQVEIPVEVPENDAPYVIGAFVLDPTEGLAIANQPAMHDCTRAFYMNVEAPSVIKRGEQVGLRLTIFNYWDQDLEVLAMLHGGEYYRFVNVEDYGYANSYSPRLSAGDVQTMVELQAGENKWIYFPIVATIESGEITVTVSVYSFLRIDVEEITIEIGFDGVENDDQIPYLIDLVNQGSIIIPDFDIPIPERFYIPNERKLLYVPGSNTVTVYLWGNVVCPGFFEDYLNAGNTAGVPVDSTDGYAYDVAINYQILHYLQIVNSLDRDTLNKALGYMKDVLPRLYSNMQADGSFKMFSRSKKPCLWVTAFVLKTLHAVHESEWNEDLYISVDLINKVAIWIAKQQNNVTGAFEETADNIYNRNLNPDTTTEDGTVHRWHLSVTAWVTIALARADRLTGNAKPPVDTAKSKAGDYLSNYVQQITDPFQMAIVAYALNELNHKSKDDAYARLKSMKRTSEWVYWADEEITPNPTRIVNTVHFMLPRDDFPNNQLANMATSYALMLFLDHNEFEDSKPIMEWLNTQHNDFLAWSSTQDTLLVLEALTAYAFRETNRDIYQMEVRLIATRDPDWEHVVRLNSSNFAQLHTFELEEAWGQIKAYAQGTGYAFLHVGAFHKVEHREQVAGPDFEALSFDIDKKGNDPDIMLNYHGRNGSIMDATICTKWLRPDISDEAGQSFVSLEIPTGYNVPRSNIEAIYRQNVPGLSWVDFSDGTLTFMFEYVKQRKTCFSFRANRWWPVANMSIPHVVNLFEYAETGLQLNTMYESLSLFHNHICQVCGSFQCPYCPDYNTAHVWRPSVVMILVLAALTPLLWKR